MAAIYIIGFGLYMVGFYGRKGFDKLNNYYKEWNETRKYNKYNNKPLETEVVEPGNMFNSMFRGLSPITAAALIK
jgi:hypothetical protein